MQSKLVTAERIQNWSETFVVADNGRQDFRSYTLLVDTNKFFEEEIHFVLSELWIVQTEENLNYTITETKIEYRSLAFATSEEFSEGLSVQVELLQERTEGPTELQHV